MPWEIISPLLCWFSLNNSQKIKAETLLFCNIQYYFIRDIHAKFNISNWAQPLDIGPKSDVGISDFQISGQSLIKESFHNSRTSDDIDMKLEPVTKIDKRNKITSKNLTVTSCQQVLTSLLFFQFMATMEQSRSRILDAYSVKLTFSLEVTFYLTKTENRAEKSVTQLLHYCFE